VSCYALFKGWLLLSQPTGCFSDSTSLHTKLVLRGLSRWSGLFPSRQWSLSPTVSLLKFDLEAFVVWLGLVSSRPHIPSRALPPQVIFKAAPKCISGRTSYLRVRLAFHLYPQLIPSFCNRNGFEPSLRDYRSFTLAMGSSPGFGSTRRNCCPIRTRFRYGSSRPRD
jgi:hypothetical protein